MKVLQFYTSTGQRDDERVASQDALLSPTWKFLPFQIQRDHITSSDVTEVELVDCDGNETDVIGYFDDSTALLTGWANSGVPVLAYGTFDTSGTSILTAIEGATQRAYGFSNEFALATGEAIKINYILTLNSGSLPSFYLGGDGGEHYSNAVVLASGGNTVYLAATSNDSGNVRLLVENAAGNDTSFECLFPAAVRTSLTIAHFTTYDFITYNGTPLNERTGPGTLDDALNYGVYYLRLSDGNTKWYSEWFSVENIQPQILTGYDADSYDTFTTLEANITSGINLAGSAIANSNQFEARTGEIFIYTYNLTLNSGQAPFARLGAGFIVSNNPQISVGLNQEELISTYSGTVRLDLANSDAANFALASVSLRRKSGEYVHLEFTNTLDFNNLDDSIYYAGGWTQQAYLRAYENLPSHESIEIGDEKNGEFETEKLVRKYTRSVISYESRSMYSALTLLKHHSTIKILDEVGIEHTPKVGNVDVSIDWNTFDTGSLRIAWNETGTVWTNSMDNIV